MPVCLYICQIPKEEHIHPLNLAAIAPEKWWGRLLREGPPWRPGPRPPPRRRGSHPSTVRPRSTSTITRRPYHKMMICLFAWWCFFESGCVLYLHDFYMISIGAMISIWFLFYVCIWKYITYIVLVFLAVCTCELKIRTLDARHSDFRVWMSSILYHALCLPASRGAFEMNWPPWRM